MASPRAAPHRAHGITRATTATHFACLTNTAAPPTRRAQCTACLRPQAACLCACVQRVATRVQVLVLQHPDEVGHAKNTARLLHLCLPRSQLAEGEAWDATALEQLLHAPWQEGNSATTPAAPNTVLLYPPFAPDAQLPVSAPPPLPDAWLAAPQLPQLRLVVLDATWRKSRKMLYLNPLLQQLPRLALAQLPPSRYSIRKAHQAGQLSSFEATAAALAQLEGWAADALPLQHLHTSFDAAMHWHHHLQAAYAKHSQGHPAS